MYVLIYIVQYRILCNMYIYNINYQCMYVCTGIQNQRECIINEQLLIRDDIQRVAGELENLNNEIETHIARNTSCV